MNIYTIYDHPLDFPTEFVARRFEFDKPTNVFYANRDLKEVRGWVEKQLLADGVYGTCMPRSPEDDPCILETWL